MNDLLERVVRIETTAGHIKDTLDRLVDNTDSHLLQSHKNALDIAEIKIRLLRLEEAERPQATAQLQSGASNTKIASVSAGAAGLLIGIIEYLKR